MDIKGDTGDTRSLDYGSYWGYVGIMDKKMEATIVDWGCIGIMEKKNGSY